MRHNISYHLDNHPDKLGEVAVLIVLSYAGRRLFFSSGIRIRKEGWDKKAQRPQKTIVNASGKSAMEILSSLSSSVCRLEDIFQKLSKDSLEPDPNAIKEAFCNPNSTSANLENKTIQYWIQRFIEEMSVVREWTPATREKFIALSHHLEQVDPNLTFEDLTERGLSKILEHFRNTIVPSGGIGMRNSTIGKQFGYLGWFLNWCVKIGVCKNLDYKTFSPALKNTSKKVIFLTDDELEKLEGVNLNAPNRRHLERIRDIFLFQCYSGFRYSDVVNLKWTDIKSDTMVITTQKTRDTLTVEINSYTRKILDKYRPYQFPGNKVFPAPTNQEANRYLKELCRLAEIDEPVTIVFYKGKERFDEVIPKHQLIGTHAARRTFVVRALSLGIPPHIVMQWTGHSSFNSMKPYVDVAGTARAEAMKVFDNQSK